MQLDVDFHVNHVGLMKYVFETKSGVHKAYR